MDSKFKELKNNFIQYNLYEKVEISPEEYEKTESAKLKDHVKGNDIAQLYKMNPVDYTEDEMNQAIQLKVLEQLEAMNKKQNTMKDIMIFWLVLTLINIGCVIYIVSKLSEGL